MAASSPEAPTTPDPVRASDEERDRAISELGDRFAEGRISHETFMSRVDAALGARDRHQLDRLLADLPPRRRAAGTLAGLFGEVRDRAGRARRVQRVRRVLGTLAAERDALSARVRDGLAARSRPARRAAAAGRPLALLFPPGEAGSYTIGRDRDCDLFIGDLTVSRSHARLERSGDGWMLADLGSTNGTRVNGWRVRQPVLVREGDRVMFGSVQFEMCADQRPGRPSPPGQGGPGHG
jgi:hypothetical protein